MGVLLVVAAVAGYLLGGCAGDGLEGLSGATELPTITGPDLTVPDVTVPEVTLPEITVPEVTIPDVTIPDVTIPTGPQTSEVTTVELPTTTKQPPITTEPATTVIKTETETETVVVPPTETAVAAPTLAETTPGEPSSDDDNLWAWVALAAGLLAAGVTLAIILWRRRRAP